MLKLIAENDPILKQASAAFDFNDASLDPEALAAEMLQLMIFSRGIGLAGPQVGLSKSMFVMNVSKARYVFNPEILTSSPERTTYKEGCLSFPGLHINVIRPESVTVAYQNARGDRIEEALNSLDARCFLHEFDHLAGVCFIDKVPKLTLKTALAKRQKQRG
jgi:peptide deformylase